MSSTFGGLINAGAALAAQRYGLDLTGQNIANANTAGYTRQRADLQATGPVTGVPTLYATQSSSNVSATATATRVDDVVLDARMRTEQARNSQYSTTSTQLSGVESLFNEPSDNGLTEQLGGMWNSWAAVANNPTDLSARSVVLEKAAGVAASLNSGAASLATLTSTATAQLNQSVVDLNTAATSLAQVNTAMIAAKATGADTNALSDQRDGLLLTLANAGGAQATLQPDGTATVMLGGQTLVAGGTANTVGLTGTQLTVGGTATSTVGGTAQGLVDTLNTTLPTYSAKLDAVASALASTVNAAHQAGYDLAGNPGGAFFTGTTAATISVAITDPKAIAASSTPGGNTDGGTALALAGFSTKAGGADVAYQDMIGTLGSDVQRASQAASVQSAVTTTVNNQQQSVSGVSFDEETTNLLTFQRAYQASARVLTTVDDMLDTLINRTGKVGL